LKINLFFQGSKLFEGKSFYFHGKFKNPSKEDLQQLVRLGGARVCQTLARVPKNLLVIYERPSKEETSDSDSDSSEEELPDSLRDTPMVSSNWILDSVGHFELLSYGPYSEE
jgi:hypothetical protein